VLSVAKLAAAVLTKAIPAPAPMYGTITPPALKSYITLAMIAVSPTEAPKALNGPPPTVAWFWRVTPSSSTLGPTKS
jgi:hypothetical protein